MANFLFVLRSNDFEKATRCFQFARIAHGKGHQVNLFLIDSGVDWAIKDLGIVTDCARGLALDLPLTQDTLARYRQISAEGHGREDTSALIRQFDGHPSVLPKK